MKIYFFILCVALIGPQVINAVAKVSGESTESPPCNGETTPTTTTCTTTPSTTSCTSRITPPCTETPTPTTPPCTSRTTPPCTETPTPTTPPCTESPTKTTPPCTASPTASTPPSTPTTTCTTTTCTTTTCTTTTICTTTPTCTTTTLACTTLSSGGNLVEKPLQFRSSTRDCATLPDGTILLDLYHCRRYYICQNQKTKRTRCAVGDWFDSTTRQCLPRSEVTSCLAWRN